MHAEPALELRGLTVVYDGPAVLDAVTVSVLPGQVLAVLGPSGAGKSTLLHTVAGFTTPAAGEVRVAGRLVASPHHDEPAHRRDVAMVFQNHALWPHLSALDTVAYPLRRGGTPRGPAKQEARELLDLLGAGHLSDRRPAELSGGEQQRVGLARALARHPAVYLLDEPTAHLDAVVRGAFLDAVAARRHDGRAAVLHATHDAGEALAAADRVALLVGGRVVQVGTPREVYEEPVTLTAARLTGPASELDDPDGAGRVLVRPEWAALDGPLQGRVRETAYRGPHTDLLLETRHGPVLVRQPGPPVHRPGDPVTWTLRRRWPVGRSRLGQASSSAAGPA